MIRKFFIRFQFYWKIFRRVPSEWLETFFQTHHFFILLFLKNSLFSVIPGQCTKKFVFFLIWRTFNRSQTHGAEALSTIDRYSEISKFVNRSLSLVEQANNTVHVLDQQVRDVEFDN